MLSLTDSREFSAVLNRIYVLFKTNTNLKLILKSQKAPIEISWLSGKKQSTVIDDVKAEQASTPNPQLIQAVVRAHAWVRSLTDGTYDSIEALGQAVNVHPKIVRSGIRLAFLAPDITAAILAGEQPKTLSLGDFKKDIPLSWSKQGKALPPDGGRHTSTRNKTPTIGHALPRE